MENLQKLVFRHIKLKLLTKASISCLSYPSMPITTWFMSVFAIACLRKIVRFFIFTVIFVKNYNIQNSGNLPFFLHPVVLEVYQVWIKSEMVGFSHSFTWHGMTRAGPSNTGHKMSATRGAAEHHGSDIHCSTRNPRQHRPLFSSDLPGPGLMCIRDSCTTMQPKIELPTTSSFSLSTNYHPVFRYLSVMSLRLSTRIITLHINRSRTWERTWNKE
jgi:hypothetical protein